MADDFSSRDAVARGMTSNEAEKEEFSQTPTANCARHRIAALLRFGMKPKVFVVAAQWLYVSPHG